MHNLFQPLFSLVFSSNDTNLQFFHTTCQIMQNFVLLSGSSCKLCQETYAICWVINKDEKVNKLFFNVKLTPSNMCVVWRCQKGKYKTTMIHFPSKMLFARQLLNIKNYFCLWHVFNQIYFYTNACFRNVKCQNK